MARYLDLNGNSLGTISALGRTSVIIKRDGKAIKTPRRLDTTHMTDLQRSREDDLLELNLESIANEILVYGHLGRHNGILEVQTSGGVIEMPFMANGTLQNYLQTHQVDWRQKLYWIQGAAYTIHALHQKGVIHGDISTMNFLVADDNSILLIDFGESVRLETGPDGLNGFSIKTDLFQFGSLIFEIVTRQKYVFDAREGGEDEDQQWPKNDELPNTKGILLGELIQRCWVRDGFRDMLEVSNYLSAEMEGSRASQHVQGTKS